MEYKITCEIFVESEVDPEEIAQTMDAGLTDQVRDFPKGEIAGTNVAGIAKASDDEISRYFEE